MNSFEKNSQNYDTREFTILTGHSGGNPFHEPITYMAHQIKSTKWSFPYLHNIIMVLVIAFVIVVLSILYITVGVASQIVAIFAEQIEREKRRIEQQVSYIEKSGHVMAIGIYFIVVMPFWLLQVPFMVIAWMADSLIRYWKEKVKPNIKA